MIAASAPNPSHMLRKVRGVFCSGCSSISALPPARLTAEFLPQSPPLREDKSPQFPRRSPRYIRPSNLLRDACSRPTHISFRGHEFQFHRRAQRPVFWHERDPLHSDMTHAEQDETGSVVSFHQSCTCLRAPCDLRRVLSRPPAQYSARRGRSSERFPYSSASLCAQIFRSR